MWKGGEVDLGEFWKNAITRADVRGSSTGVDANLRECWEEGVVRMGVLQVVNLATVHMKMNGDGRLTGGHNAV